MSKAELKDQSRIFSKPVIWMIIFIFFLGFARPIAELEFVLESENLLTKEAQTNLSHESAFIPKGSSTVETGDTLTVLDEYLDLRFGAFTYSELLNNIEMRLEVVNAALLNPRCVIGAPDYDLEAVDECNASEFVKLGRLLEICDRSKMESPEEMLERMRSVSNRNVNIHDQRSWYEARRAIEVGYPARSLAAVQCKKFQDQLNVLPILGGFVDFGDYNPQVIVKSASYIEQATRLGYAVRPDEYAYSVSVLSSGYILSEMFEMKNSIDTMEMILAEQAKSEKFLKAMVSNSPFEGMLALVWFEMIRVPLVGIKYSEGNKVSMSDESLADRYRRALVYYYAAESMSRDTLQETMYRNAGLERSELYLNANDIEVARNQGYLLAGEYNR